MKLSLKFFCIAYTIVLMSTGFAGIFLINTVTDTLWDSRKSSVDNAEIYAVDSFLSVADMSAEKIGNTELKKIASQIKNTLDSNVDKLLISSSAPEGFENLANSEILSTFQSDNDTSVLIEICRIDVANTSYYISVHSDFGDIKAHTKTLWKAYGAVILLLSVISGMFLFVLTKKVTNPINRLTKAARRISSGDYGKTVEISSKDIEIQKLAKSFNTMSATIKQKIDEIKSESEKRSIFVADFTHEIKTPMTAIIGYAEMLSRYELDEYERRQAAEAIFKEGRRLEKLSLQLLELYVFQNEKVELEGIYLPSVQRQLESTLLFLSKKYGVSFSVNLHKTTVIANQVLLISLLYNLADNAFKASKPNSKITVETVRKAESLEFRIIDSGCGISPENIKMLTEPFFREDKSRSRELGGAGIGLSLCKEIADIHNTKLEFQSEKGKGTVVSFELKIGGKENAKA